MWKRLAACAALVLLGGCTAPGALTGHTRALAGDPTAVRDRAAVAHSRAQSGAGAAGADHVLADRLRPRAAVPRRGQQPAQLRQMDLDSDRAEEVMPQTVRPYQRPGVRVFVYEGLTGCGNDDAILRFQPPVMFPELPFEANCSVPQRYLAVFAVPAKLVPNPLDIGCTPGPITCPRR